MGSDFLYVQEANIIIYADACLRMEDLSALHMWDSVAKSPSLSDGNLAWPSGKRRPLSHSTDHMSLIRLFHKTFQKVHSQPGFTSLRTTKPSFA